MPDELLFASALTTNHLLTDANLAPLVFVSADNNLLAAAQAAGLQIDSPNLHA